ncbi:MAG: FAD-dependent oxidoreductase, partial [Pseudomonadota bacterium]
PDLVTPLSCLMPLYGNGLHRTAVFSIALRLNDLLSAQRNAGVEERIHLPGGRVLDPQDTMRQFPMVDAADLKGAALWYDACLPHSQRVLIESLRWACSLGATALNYVEATRLLVAGGRVAGIEAFDHVGGHELEFRAKTVINAAGPWCGAVAERFHAAMPGDLPYSLAWNVLFEREALSPHALAVTARKPDAQTLFLCPWKGSLLAGTAHSKPLASHGDPVPDESQIASFIDEINDAVPGIDLQEHEIRRVFAGFLPARHGAKNSLAVRETVAAHGQPAGLFSIAGIKFTTSRKVAERVLRLAAPAAVGSPQEGSWTSRSLKGLDANIDPSAEGWSRALEAVIAEESVCHLDDLVLRRTALWESPKSALMRGPDLCGLFPWNEQRRNAEVERLRKSLEPMGSLHQECAVTEPRERVAAP